MKRWREPALLLLGYGLFLSFTSVSLWGGYTTLIPAIVSSDLLWLGEYFARNVSFPLTLLAIATFAYFRRGIRLSWLVGIGFALYIVGGALLLTLLVGNVSVGDWLFFVGILFGIASACMFSAFTVLIAGQNGYIAGMVVLLAAAVSAIAFFLIGLIPSPAYYWVEFLGVLPAILIIMVMTRRAAMGELRKDTARNEKDDSETLGKSVASVKREERDLYHNAAKELWRSLLCVAFTAFIVGLFRSSTSADAEALYQVNQGNMIGLLIASVVLLFFWHALYFRVGLTNVYRVLFPLTTTVYLLLPLFESEFSNVLLYFGLTVFSIASSLMVVSCIRTAERLRLDAIIVYGFFASVVYGSLCVGTVVGLIFNETHNTTILFVIALLVIYLLSLAMALTRRKRKGEHSQDNKTRVALEAKGATEKEVNNANSGESETEHQCDRVTQRYGLTKREDEVLRLLAKGRDAPFIAKELYISQNTVRYHIKNIFAKTDVHSRQDLLNLIERELID